MKKILLIGTILILVAITGVWAEGTLDIKNITYPNGEIFSEIPIDNWGKIHGQMVNYWPDGRIYTIRRFWHGIPSDNVSYIDIAPPEIFNETVKLHQAKVNGLNKERNK